MPNLLVVVDFSAGALALLLTCLFCVLYFVHVRRRGAANDARIASLGGSAVVSQGAMDLWYWNVRVIAARLAGWGIGADQLTWTALVLGLGSGASAATGMLGLAGLLMMWSGICDMLDGLVARALGTSSGAGEAFDSAVDRYCEEAIFIGLAFHYRGQPIVLIAVLLAAFGSGMVTLSTAKAEALGVKVRGALMRRHERIGLIVFGTGISGMSIPVLENGGAAANLDGIPAIVCVGLVAVLSNVAAVQRYLRIVRAVRTPEPEDPAIARG